MAVIRQAGKAEREAIWLILEPIIRDGETYALSRDMSKEAALLCWFTCPHEVFVAEENEEVLGTYLVQPNQQGGRQHVANAGFVSAARAAGGD